MRRDGSKLPPPPQGEYVGKYGVLHLITAVLREPRSTQDDKAWLMELKELLLDSVKELNRGEGRGKLYAGREQNPQG